MKLLHIVENWSQSLRQCWIAGVPRWRRHGSGTQASGQLSFEDNVSLDQNEPDDKRQREEQGQGWIRLCGLDITWQQPKCCVTASGEEKKYCACAHTHLVPHMRNPVTAACHSFGLETIFKDYLSTRHQFARKKQVYINWEDVWLANWKNATKRWEFRRKEVLCKDRDKKIREKKNIMDIFVNPLFLNYFFQKCIS